MDKYFPVEVNRAMCAEYADLCLSRNDKSEAGKKRKEEIRQHLAFEVLAAYAHDHGPEDK